MHASLGKIFCKSVNEIWSYHANKLCDGRTDPEHFYVPPMASPWRESITIKLGTAYASWTKIIRPPVMTQIWHQWWPWEVTMTSNHWNNIIIIFPDPKQHIKVVLFMSVALFCFVAFTRVVVILDFANMAAPWGRPSWRPSKIEKVWFGQHMCQIWCFWKNLNQKSLTAPTITNFWSFMVIYWIGLLPAMSFWCNRSPVMPAIKKSKILK